MLNKIRHAACRVIRRRTTPQAPAKSIYETMAECIVKGELDYLFAPCAAQVQETEPVPVPEPVDISAKILRAVNAVLACDRMLFLHFQCAPACVVYLRDCDMKLFANSALWQSNTVMACNNIALVCTSEEHSPSRVVCGIISRELGSNYCTVG